MISWYLSCRLQGHMRCVKEVSPKLLTRVRTPAMVTAVQNVVFIVHSGHGDATQGEAITSAMRREISALRNRGVERIAVYHDVSALESAGDDYIKAFAGLAKELGNQGFCYVATMPKAWVRVLAKTAAFLGGIDTHFFKAEAESLEFLRREGFAVEPLAG